MGPLTGFVVVIEPILTMYELSERQKLILALVIRDYIETAQPVGSRHLVENYQLNFSSATVRNEMVALTDMGFLRQPHTSAGRVPSEDGYRYFVRQLMGHTDLPAPDQAHHHSSVLPGRHRYRPLDAPGCFCSGSPITSRFPGNGPPSGTAGFQAYRVDQHARPTGPNGAGSGRR